MDSFVMIPDQAWMGICLLASQHPQEGENYADSGSVELNIKSD